MRRIAATIFRNCEGIFGVAVLFAFATISSASAETVTKSFEIGIGTAHPSSHFRTFSLPCGTRMVTSVTYSRSGDAGVNNDVPLFIEVRKPGATTEEDGPRAEAKENIKATRVPQTASFAGSTTNRGGCSIPWRVRVRHDADGPAPNAVSGSIIVSFDTATSSISVGSFGLNKSTSVTKNFGGPTGLNQGRVEITANWAHTILGAPGPNPSSSNGS